jgi:hypothetical protein
MTLPPKPTIPQLTWALSGSIDGPQFPSGSVPTKWEDTGYNDGDLVSFKWWNKKLRTISDYQFWGTLAIDKIDGFLNSNEYEITGSFDNPAFQASPAGYRNMQNIFASIGNQSNVKAKVLSNEYFRELWESHVRNNDLPNYEQVGLNNPTGQRARNKYFPLSQRQNFNFEARNLPSRRADGTVLNYFQTMTHMLRDPVRVPRYHMVGHACFRWGTGASDTPATPVVYGCIQSVGNNTAQRNTETGGWYGASGMKTITLKPDFFTNGDDYMVHAQIVASPSSATSRNRLVVLNKEGGIFDLMYILSDSNLRQFTNNSGNFGTCQVSIFSKRQYF